MKREERRRTEQKQLPGRVLPAVVAHKNLHSHALGGGQEQVCGRGGCGTARGHLAPLGLVAAVLEPDLHLGLRQLQRRRQVRALWSAQVALVAEAALELEHLRVREGCA